jgi:hypothetical protein
LFHILHTCNLRTNTWKHGKNAQQCEGARRDTNVTEVAGANSQFSGVIRNKAKESAF